VSWRKFRWQVCPAIGKGNDLSKHFFELGVDLGFKMWEQMWERFEQKNLSA
jgi:hypothetical protein